MPGRAAQSRSLQTQLLIQRGKLAQRSPPLGTCVGLVGQHVLHRQPPLFSNHTGRQRAALNQADEIRSRNIKQLCGLLGGEFGLNRDKRYRVAGGQLFQPLGK